MNRPSNILVIDDSQTIRRAIMEIFESSRLFKVVEGVNHGKQALAMISTLKPDVISLDISSHQHNGLSTLKHIMIFYPTPVVVLNSLVHPQATFMFDALSYGAVDCTNNFLIPNTQKLDDRTLEAKKKQLIQTMASAAHIKHQALQYIHLKPSNKTPPIQAKTCKNLVIIGVAEGGYSALLKIIPKLTRNNSTAYIVIFYDTEGYLYAFMDYLDHFSMVDVKPAINHASLVAGTCYLSAGDEYVTVHKGQKTISLYVSPAPFLSRRGSIDMLMFSVAEILEKSLGVILSGAGNDGAEGVEEIVRVGGEAIIQSPTSCLYENMPTAALNLCEEKTVVADREIATEINNFLIYSVN